MQHRLIEGMRVAYSGVEGAFAQIACEKIFKSPMIMYFKNFDGVFGRPECWKCEIPVSGSGEQHVGIFKDFANAVLNGTELLAPGEEGINGLTISNSIHYSAWTGKTVETKNFPHDEFYELLQEKIRNSTVDKSNVKRKASDTSGTY